MTTYTRSEVEDHNTEADYWAIIEGYVVDLSSFLQDHPGTARRIKSRRNQDVDVTSNFVDHFSGTVRKFRSACETFEELQQPVEFFFNQAPEAPVTIRGKVAVEEID